MLPCTVSPTCVRNSSWRTWAEWSSWAWWASSAPSSAASSCEWDSACYLLISHTDSPWHDTQQILFLKNSSWGAQRIDWQPITQPASGFRGFNPPLLPATDISHTLAFQSSALNNKQCHEQTNETKHLTWKHIRHMRNSFSQLLTIAVKMNVKCLYWITCRAWGLCMANYFRSGWSLVCCN